MADTDYLVKRSRSSFAKKLMRKYGKYFFEITGGKGWETRKDLMLKKTGKYETNKH